MRRFFAGIWIGLSTGLLLGAVLLLAGCTYVSVQTGDVSVECEVR